MASPSKDYRREIDAVYPEPLSRLNRIELNPSAYKRAARKKMVRSGRFRTTPVTFNEIKEVDEEVGEEESDSSVGSSCRSEHDLRKHFEAIIEERRPRRVSQEVPPLDPLDDNDSPESQESFGEDTLSCLDTFDLRPCRSRPHPIPKLRTMEDYPTTYCRLSRPSI